MKMEAAPSYRSRPPPETCPWIVRGLVHGEVYQTSVAVGLMASLKLPLSAGLLYHIKQPNMAVPVG